MEAVAALSLACNVIQMVDYAGKIVLVIRETYNSGASKDNIGLEKRAKCLGDLSKNLSTSLNRAQTQSHTTPTESKLQVQAAESLKIAEELQSELNQLKSKGGRREGLRKGWRAIRKKGDISKLEKRLHDQESLLDSGLLVHLKYVYLCFLGLLKVDEG